MDPFWESVTELFEGMEICPRKKYEAHDQHSHLSSEYKIDEIELANRSTFFACENAKYMIFGSILTILLILIFGYILFKINKAYKASETEYKKDIGYDIEPNKYTRYDCNNIIDNNLYEKEEYLYSLDKKEN